MLEYFLKVWAWLKTKQAELHSGSSFRRYIDDDKYSTKVIRIIWLGHWIAAVSEWK